MFKRGEHRHRVADRQGHAAVRLHDRDRAGRRLYLGRHGRAADRPDADTGGRHAHALDARRSRRDDLGLAQSLSTTTASSCSAPTATSSPTTSSARSKRRWTAISRRSSPRVPTSAAPGASRACTTATSSSPSARCRAPSSLAGLRVVADCANGAAYRVVPEALWELGAEVVSIGVEPDGFNINRDCGSTAPRSSAARCASCAPISASRSTATPTA